MSLRQKHLYYLGGLACILLALFVYLFYPKNKTDIQTLKEVPITLTYKSFIDDTTGLSSKIPVNWTITKNHNTNPPTTLVSSPDFSDVSKNRGYGDTYVEKGIQIAIHDFQVIDPSIHDPEAFMAFNKEIHDSCSNCVSFETTLTNDSTITVETSEFSFSDNPTMGNILLNILHNKKLYKIIFSYPAGTRDESLAKEALWVFSQNLSFTK